MLQVWIKTLKHTSSPTKIVDRMKIDLVGPLVDTAGDEAACTSFQDGEDDTHTSKIPYNVWLRTI